MAELYSNALEHGVLQLNSDLKNTEDGYMEYYQQRETRLQELEGGQVDIQVQFSAKQNQGLLSIQISDSGKGFDTNNRQKSSDEDSFGRGIDLLETLCDKVTYSKNGTRVEVEYTVTPD